MSGRAVLETLALFAIVFVLQQVALIVGAVGLMTGLFVLESPIETNPWTVVTSVYAHNPADIGHLVSNSIGLVIFGWPIARTTTRLRFHAFFVVAGAIAGVSQIVVTEFAVTLAGGNQIPGVLGASGAVFALMGYLIAGNRISDVLASRVQVPTWLTLLIFAILAAAITLLTYAPRIALIAHFTGFFLGLVAGRAGVLEPSSRARVDRTAA